VKVYLQGAGIALMIVTAQVFWKMGSKEFEFTKEFLFSKKGVDFLLSGYTLVGMLLYGLATVFYMALLGRYEYSQVQSIIIPLSLVMAFLVASIFFKEDLSFINWAGLVLLVGGMFLATSN
jgi:drug/metabolite transporter (DMT)-like permease